MTITDVQWQMSGEVILMTLLGGLGTFFGPVLGSGIVISLQDLLADRVVLVTTEASQFGAGNSTPDPNAVVVQPTARPGCQALPIRRKRHTGNVPIILTEKAELFHAQECIPDPDGAIQGDGDDASTVRRKRRLHHPSLVSHEAMPLDAADRVQNPDRHIGMSNGNDRLAIWRIRNAVDSLQIQA